MQQQPCTSRPGHAGSKYVVQLLHVWLGRTQDRPPASCSRTCSLQATWCRATWSAFHSAAHTADSGDSESCNTGQATSKLQENVLIAGRHIGAGPPSNLSAQLSVQLNLVVRNSSFLCAALTLSSSFTRRALPSCCSAPGLCPAQLSVQEHSSSCHQLAAGAPSVQPVL